MAMTQEFGEDDYLAMQCDLRQPAAVARLLATIEKRFGGLDILINNIERGGMPVLHGSYSLPVNREQWQLEMETTLHCLLIS